MRQVLRGVMVAALLAASAASAQVETWTGNLGRRTVPAADPVRDVLPRSGAYYSPASSGTGVLLEVGRDGFVFGSFFFHAAPGDREWTVVAGQFEPSDYATWAETGETGRLVAAFNATNMPANGSIGFNGTGAPAATVPTGQPPIELTWFGPERVRVRWNGTEQMLTALMAIDPAGGLDQRIVGAWRVVELRTWQPGSRNPNTGAVTWEALTESEYVTGDVVISAGSASPMYAAGTPPLAIPSDSATWFVAETRSDRLRAYTGNTSGMPDTLLEDGSELAYGLGTWWMTTVGLTDAWRRIYFNPSTGLHEALYTCTVSGASQPCEQTTGGVTRRRVDPTAVASRFYFVSPDRVVVRTFRYASPTRLEHINELVLDRKTEGVEQQGTAGCTLRDYQRFTSAQRQNCGRNGTWP